MSTEYRNRGAVSPCSNVSHNSCKRKIISSLISSCPYLPKGPLAERLAEFQVRSGELPGGVERQFVLGDRGERRALGAEPGLLFSDIVRFQGSNVRACNYRVDGVDGPQEMERK